MLLPLPLSLLLHYRINLHELLAHIQVEVDSVERHSPQVGACGRELAIRLHILKRFAVERKHLCALGTSMLRRIVYLHRLVEVSQTGVEISVGSSVVGSYHRVAHLHALVVALHGEQHGALSLHSHRALGVDSERTVADVKRLGGVATLEAVVEQMGEEVARRRVVGETFLQRSQIADRVGLCAVGLSLVLERERQTRRVGLSQLLVAQSGCGVVGTIAAVEGVERCRWQAREAYC